MSKIWAIFLMTFLAMSVPVAAVEAEPPPITLNSCSYAECKSTSILRADLSSDFITIALADSLLDNKGEIEAVLASNPNIRIAPSKDEAEYLLARYPDFPDTLILIDIDFHFPDDGTLQRFDRAEEYIAELYYRLALFFPPWVAQVPSLVGQLDDGSFANRLHDEANKILWFRRLLAKANDNPAPKIKTTIRALGLICSKDAGHDCWDRYSLTTENLGNSKKYVAVIRFDNENGIRILRPLNPSKQLALQPGAIETRDGIGTVSDTDLTPESNKQYVYVTISSDRPIDRNLLGSPDNIIPQISENWQVSIWASDASPPETGGGGYTALPLSAPWQVQLYATNSVTPRSLRANTTLNRVDWQIYEKTHRCGGTLIAKNIVLTAAHCIANRPFSGSLAARQSVFKHRRVKLGTQNLRYGGTTLAIDSIVVHKNYRPGGHPNDIALIRLKPDHSTVPRIWRKAKPVKLPSARVASNSKVSWYGWGVTKEVDGSNTRMTSAGRAQRNPAALRYGEMDILTRKLCKKRPGYGRKVTSFMLCAVTPRNSGRRIFTCLGDSGGPIIGYENGKRVQVGIISWAVGCGANDNPSVSAYVYPYLRWIAVAKTKFVSGRVVQL